MTYDQLPDHWRERATAHAKASPRTAPAGLGAADFPSASVQLVFDDGSRATFRHSFFLEDVVRGELAVFTEHCGHHIFRRLSLQSVTAVHERDETAAGSRE